MLADKIIGLFPFELFLGVEIASRTMGYGYTGDLNSSNLIFSS